MSLKGRTPELLGSLSSRVPGTQATFDIPLSHTYFTFALHLVVNAITITPANVATYVKKISLKVNGEARYEISGSLLPVLWTYRGTNVSDNFIPMLLAQPHMQTALGQDVTGYGTLDMNSFGIVVELESGAHTIDLLDLYAVRGANTPLGPHYRLSSYARASTGAGDLELTGVFRPAQRVYSVLMDTASMDSILMKAGSEMIHNTKKEPREGFLQLSERTEGTNTAIDMCEDNRLEDAFEVAGRDVRFTLDMTAATPFNVLTESVENMLGLG